MYNHICLISQGPRWNFGQVTASSDGEPFQILFEAVTGDAPDSYSIALDDVKVLPGACKPKGSCDFETDLCGYVNSIGEGKL